jgi:predicted Zn-dependent protease with MMP-like domain
MPAMELEEFKALVADALSSLPDQFLDLLDNVAVVVEEWPDRETMRQVGAASPYNLLGLYHGTPQTVRPSSPSMTMPDKISIYQRPIEAIARTPEEVRSRVRQTVVHEIAHHFGISDARLRQLGAY